MVRLGCGYTGMGVVSTSESFGVLLSLVYRCTVNERVWEGVALLYS